MSTKCSRHCINQKLTGSISQHKKSTKHSQCVCSQQGDSLTSATVNYWRELQAHGQSAGHSSTRNVRAPFYQPYISRRAMTSPRHHDKGLCPIQRTHLNKKIIPSLHLAAGVFPSVSLFINNTSQDLASVNSRRYIN